MTSPVRYRFDAFALSPRQRLLLRDGCPVPLIPKYFDLLVLLVRHRNEAVSKQQIFGEIWSDEAALRVHLAQPWIKDFEKRFAPHMLAFDVPIYDVAAARPLEL